jgi:pimeloyl-ACP methyl ester carboxylesterase/predicted ester cyclase
MSLFLAACASYPRPAAGRFHSDRISVTTYGSGPDVVLIPGLSSSAEQVWSGTVRAVPGYRYHLVQVAGFAGVPAGANAGDGPVIQPLADEIIRYLQEQHLDRPALIGLSMGGSLAMMVAARQPQAVSKLMVVDMVPFMGVFFGGMGATPEGLRPVAERVRGGMLSASDEARRASLAASIATMIRTERLREGVLATGFASDPSVSARAMYDLILQDLRPEMSRVQAPVTVLYVHGPLVSLGAEETDAVYRASYATTPRVSLKRIPDAYHFIMLDQPGRFAQEVRDFLGSSVAVASSEANKDLVRRFYAAVNRGDYAAADSMVSPSFRHYVVSDTGFRAVDWAAFKRGNAGARGAFPDWEIAPLVLVAEGEYVSALLMGRGTHRGSLGGEAPTGRSTRLPIALLHQIRDGKLIADWEVVNTEPAMEALRSSPAPARAGTPPD